MKIEGANLIVMDRLFGKEIVSDDPLTEYLEVMLHVELTRAGPGDATVIVDQMVGHVRWKGLGDKHPMGWRQRKVDDRTTLEVVTLKSKEARAA